MDKPRSSANIVFSALLFTIIAPGTITILIPALLRSTFTPPVDSQWHIVGAVLIVIGILIYLWCTYDFIMRGRGTPNPDDPPAALVTSGLYRFSRNPMYVGILTIVLGEAFWFWHLPTFIMVLVFFTIVHLRVLMYEEPELRRLFGGSYEDYMKSVPRWIGPLMN